MAQGEAVRAEDVARATEASRVTRCALGLNVSLCALKLAAGLVGHSQAVVADAFHTLSDSGTDVLVLIGVRYWSRPADSGHPHGHRRIETLVTALLGATLAAVAVGIAYRAIATLKQQHPQPPGSVALAAAVASILVKEGLYRWAARVGKRIRSPAILANAWHYRADALSSVPVALAVAGAKLRPEWYFLDHIAAVLISVLLVGAALGILRPALGELVDASASQRDQERIRDIAMSVPGVRVVHAVRTRHLGSGCQVDLHILVDGELTVRQGHDISEEVKRRLLADGPEVIDAVVHLEPLEDDAPHPPERP